jgi:hypothetical protein
VRNLGHLLVGERRVTVNLFEHADLKSTPLDAKVLRIADSMRAGEVIVCEIPAEEFLAEDQGSDRARIRRSIAEALDTTSPTGASGELPPKFGALADSIEDVAVVEIKTVPRFLSTLSFSTPATFFVPASLFGLLDLSGQHNRCIVSSAWRNSTIEATVFAVESPAAVSFEARRRCSY